jgi:hypothetical protein
LSLYRALGDGEGTVRALEWLALAEQYAGQFDRAIAALSEALEHAEGDARMYVAGNLACNMTAQGDPRAIDLAREAFALARDAHHSVLIPSAITYLAAASTASDPARAARLFGYARARLDELDWQPDNTDVLLAQRLTSQLSASLGDARLSELIALGSSMSPDRASAEAADV